MKTILYQSSKTFAKSRVHTFLLSCGILSSIFYVLMNIVCAASYDGYNAASQTVSELSAIDAPTRPLWVSMAIVYSLLSLAFGWAVLQLGSGNRYLRTVGAMLLINAALGFFWPPMHQREVLAAGGGSLTDTLHLVFTAVTVSLMVAAIVFGAMALGRKFRIYSIATLFILVLFGILTGIESPQLEKGLPTPLIGVWERINIGVYMLWIAIFAVALFRQGGEASIDGSKKS